MSQPATVRVKQLTSRLENATASERLDVLQEFQTLARTEATLIGEFALQRVLDFLKEQGSAEEYQEALDLIDRLIKTRDRVAATANTEIILSSNGNVELLLDLLEHEDLTVGVMASQLLTEVHSNAPLKLESCIQDCPAGMNKLLQRLPDRNREEVSNQAIVLVQQLTVHNEEMKKTVVFNEGFEILFGIIRSEGGSADSGIVVQDCLRICSNILLGSEICQRFFFGMGVEWVSYLHQFFDPSLVENLNLNNVLEKWSEENGDEAWFDQPTRVGCAALALKSLAGALEVINPKHQKLVALQTSVVPSAAFWLARKGPDRLVEAALLLLFRVVQNNADVAAQVADMMVEVSPAVSGKTYPKGVEVPAVYYGWRPLPSDDRRFVTIPALLAERYIFSCSAWSPAPVSLSPSSSPVADAEEFSLTTRDVLSVRCMHVLEALLRADPTTCDMMIQFILAPPPPSAQDEALARGEASSLENIRPLGVILLSTLLEGSGRFLGGNIPNGGVDVTVVERSANVLTLLFLSGGQLARELSTVINTSHAAMSGKNTRNPPNNPQPLLPFLLATAGKAARIAGGGHFILVGLLRLLSAVVSGCNVAARQLLEDPSNFFVVDLASTTGESAGLPQSAQVVACLFLGACFIALKDPTQTEGTQDDQSNHLTQRSFLSMIDTRIGLTRFVDLLRRPLAAARSPAGSSLASELFFSSGFKSFYEQQVDSIRKGIFDLYAGGGEKGAGDGEGPLREIVEMQKEKIQELEAKISTLSGDEQNNSGDVRTDVRSDELSNEIKELSMKIVELEECLAVLENEKKESEIAANLLNEQLYESERNLTLSTSKILLLEEALEARADDLDSMVRGEAVIAAEADLLRRRAEASEKTVRQYEMTLGGKMNKSGDFSTVDLKKLMDEMGLYRARADAAEGALNDLKRLTNGAPHTPHTGPNTGTVQANAKAEINVMELTDKAQYEHSIVSLKESILHLDGEKESLQAMLTQRDKKIELLEEDLRGPVPYEMGREKKISDLESRNNLLTQQLWLAEAELKSSRNSPTATADLPEESFTPIARCVLSLMNTLGVDQSAEIAEVILDQSVVPSDRMYGVVRAMELCEGSVSCAVSRVVDVAQCMGLCGGEGQGFRGQEGTILRLNECIDRIDEEHSLTLQRASQSEFFKAELDAAQAAAEQAKLENTEFIKRMTKLNDELNFYKNENLDTMMKKEIVIISQATTIEGLSKKNNALTASIEENNERQKVQELQVMELNTKIVELESIIATNVEGNVSNSTALAEAKQAIKAKDEEISSISNRVSELTAAVTMQEKEGSDEIVRLTAAMAGLQAEIESSEASRAEAGVEMAESRATISHLTETNGQHTELMSKQEQLLNISDAKIAQLQEEMDELVESLLAIETSKDEESDELHTHIEKLTDEINEFNKRNELLKQQNSVLEEGTSLLNQEISLLKDDSSLLKDENFSLKSSLQNERIKVHNLENKLIANEEHFSEQSRSEEVQCELETKLEIANQKISLLTSQIFENNGDEEEIERLKSVKVDLEQSIAEVESRLHGAVSTLSNEVAAKNHEIERLDLLAQIDDLTELVRAQASDPVAITAGAGAIPHTEEGDNNTRVIEELQGELLIFNEKTVILTNTLSDRINEITTLAAALNDKEIAIKSLKNENHNLVSEYKTKDLLILEIVGAKETLEAEIGRFLDESRTIKEELEASLENSRIREIEMQKTVTELARVEKELKDKEVEISSLLEEISKLKTREVQRMEAEEKDKEKVEKERQERVGKEEDSRNFYSLQLLKVQTRNGEEVEKLMTEKTALQKLVELERAENTAARNSIAGVGEEENRLRNTILDLETVISEMRNADVQRMSDAKEAEEKDKEKVEKERQERVGKEEDSRNFYSLQLLKVQTRNGEEIEKLMTEKTALQKLVELERAENTAARNSIAGVGEEENRLRNTILDLETVISEMRNADVQRMSDAKEAEEKDKEKVEKERQERVGKEEDSRNFYSLQLLKVQTRNGEEIEKLMTEKTALQKLVELERAENTAARNSIAGVGEEENRLRNTILDLETVISEMRNADVQRMSDAKEAEEKDKEKVEKERQERVGKEEDSRNFYSLQLLKVQTRNGEEVEKLMTEKTALQKLVELERAENTAARNSIAGVGEEENRLRNTILDLETVISEMRNADVQRMSDAKEAEEKDKEKVEKERQERVGKEEDSRNFYSLQLLKVQTRNGEEIEKLMTEKTALQKLVELERAENTAARNSIAGVGEEENRLRNTILDLETVISEMRNADVQRMSDAKEAEEKDKEKVEKERQERVGKEEDSRNFYSLQLLKVQTRNGEEIEKLMTEKTALQKLVELERAENTAARNSIAGVGEEENRLRNTILDLETVISEMRNADVQRMSDAKEAEEKDKEKVEKERQERVGKEEDSRNFYSLQLLKVQTRNGEEIEKLMTEKTALQKLVELERAENTAARNSIAGVGEEENRLRNTILDLESEIQNLRSSVHESGKQVVAVNQKLSDLNLEICTMKEGRNMLQSQRNVLQDENDVLVITIATLESERTILEDEKNVLAAQKNVLEKKAADGGRDVAASKDLQTKLKHAMQEIEKMKTEKAFLNALHAEERDYSEEKISELIQDIALYSISNKALQEEIKGLTDVIEDGTVEVQELRERLAAAQRSTESNAAISTQQVEINRLCDENKRMFSELQQKESDLRASNSTLKKREGEIAGIRSSVYSLEEELTVVRLENSQLEVDNSVESRKNKELIREIDSLKSNLSIEREQVDSLILKNQILEGANSRSQSRSSTPSKTRLSITDAEATDLRSSRVALTDVIVWLESKTAHSDTHTTLTPYTGPNGSTGRSVLSPRKENGLSPYRVSFASSFGEETVCGLVERTKVAASTVLTERELMISKQTALVGELEKRLVEAQCRLEGGAQPRSPYGSPMSARPSMAGALIAATRAGSVSASGKEVARLHLVVTQERRRLSELNEQHADLLGLLAQQEVELGVFRSMLESQCGEAAVIKAENRSKLAAINTYGTYTSFRQSSSLDRTSLFAADSD